MLAFLAAVFGTMVAEAGVSRRNERALGAMGALEPADDVYSVMQWAYPICFLATAVERPLVSGAMPDILWPGVALFTAAKALKWWAIASLGTRWCFRILVPPHAPLIATGPYRYLRHPNYLAVVGELAGAAIAMRAPVAGIVGVLGFGALMRRRIAIEERELKGSKVPRFQSFKVPRFSGPEEPRNPGT